MFVSKKYLLEPVEIAGPYALFANPASGSQLCSYPIPTPSALKGILECVHFMKQAVVRIGKVEICRNPTYDMFGFNAHASSWRKDSQRTAGTTLQRKFSTLVDPVYVIHAYVENLQHEDLQHVEISERAKAFLAKFPKQTNAAHAFQEIFARKLHKGSFVRTPCLGKQMFTSTYCGPVRYDAQGNRLHVACSQANFTVTNLLASCFDKTQHGTSIQSQYLQNVECNNGVVVYDKTIETYNFSHKKVAQGDLAHA